MAQVSGVIITATAGTGIWFIVAAMSQPKELGSLGQVVSTSTFVAGLVTAGLGQFFLTIVRSTLNAQLRRYMFFGMLTGASASGLLVLLITAIQFRELNLVVLASTMLCTAIAITNLQDALYLGVGFLYDIPAKNAAIQISRLALLIGLTRIRVSLGVFLLAFVASQLAVGTLWFGVRGAAALKRHASLPSVPGRSSTIWTVLLVSYLYSIAVTTIVTGVPTLITSLVDSQQAGQFYMAWTMAGLLGSLSVAVANSVLALTIKSDSIAKWLVHLLSGLAAALVALGAVAAVVLPHLLSFLDQDYAGALKFFPVLVLGQVFFGTSIVALAAYRSLAPQRQVMVLLVGWPLIVVILILFGLLNSGLIGGMVGFVVGNVATTTLVCTITLGKILGHGRSADLEIDDTPS